MKVCWFFRVVTAALGVALPLTAQVHAASIDPPPPAETIPRSRALPAKPAQPAPLPNNPADIRVEPKPGTVTPTNAGEPARGPPCRCPYPAHGGGQTEGCGQLAGARRGRGFRPRPC